MHKIITELGKSFHELNKTIEKGNEEARLRHKSFEDSFSTFFKSWETDWKFHKAETHRIMDVVNGVSTNIDRFGYQFEHLKKLDDIAGVLVRLENASDNNALLQNSITKDLLANNTSLGRAAMKAQSIIGQALILILTISGLAIIGTMLGLTGYDINFGHGSSVISITRSTK